MKKTILLAAIALIQMSINAETLTHTFYFSETEFNVSSEKFNNTEYDILSNREMGIESIENSYDLPSGMYVFSLPVNACEISVSMSASDRVLMLSDCRIFPHQESHNSSISDVSPNTEASETPNYISSAKIINQGFYDGDSRYIVISICPFDYNPQTKELHLNRECFLNIDFTYGEKPSEGAKSIIPVSRHNTGVTSDKNSFATNKNDATDDTFTFVNKQQRYPAQKQPTITTFNPNFKAYPYTIITSEALAPSFKRLEILRKIQGYDAGIVKIEDILRHPDFTNGDIISGINDDAGKLRAFLTYAYEHYGTTYVLLGGNSDIIPVRYGTGKGRNPLLQHNCDEYSIPSDLYYSDLNSNWNIDQQSDDYGKESDNLDYSPELYIGRLLCSKPEDVENYIDKLEVYTFRPGIDDPSYLLSATEVYMKDFDHHKTLIHRELDNVGFEYETFVETAATSIKGSDVVSSVNSSPCGLFTHHGHANPRALHTTYDTNRFYHNIYALDWQKNKPEENYTDTYNGLNNLKNRNKPFIMQSMGCTTAPLDRFKPLYYPDTISVAHSFTLGQDYGGVAYLGNSRPGYYYPNCNIPENDRRSVYQMQALWDQISNGVVILGKAEANSKSPLHYPEMDNVFSHKIRLSHHLIGDPLIKVWTDIPKKYPTISGHKNTSKSPYSGFTAYACPLNSFDLTRINIEDIDKQTDCAIYLIPDDHNVLPIFPQLNINSFTFSQHNVLYCESLRLGKASAPVSLKEFSDITFRAFGNVNLNNVDLYANASLTIITSGDVTIGDLNISPSATLTIRCDKCDLSNSDIIGNGRISIYEYSAHNTKRALPAKAESQYQPMVVMGRCWEYIEESRGEEPGSTLRDLVLKIDGEEKIESEDYVVVHVYYDGETTPDQGIPLCYLRETNDGKVFARVNPEYNWHDSMVEIPDNNIRLHGAEFLLVDYSDFYASESFFPDEYFGNADFVPVDTGVYNGKYSDLTVWEMNDNERLLLVESVGYVKPMWPASLISRLTGFPAGASHTGWLYLQRVKDEDGSIVYELDNMYSSLEKIHPDSSDVMYFDLYGRRVTPKNMSTGIYIMYKDGRSQKIIVR